MKVFLHLNSRETEDMMREVVAPLGVTIESSSNPRVTKDTIAAADCPVLAILSVSAGQASALTLCEELTATHTNKPVSVILLGTDNTVNSVAKAFASGADDYIALPCNVTVLAAQIGAAVRRMKRFGPTEKIREPSSSSRKTGSLLSTPTSRASESVHHLGEASTSARPSENRVKDEFLSIPTLRDAKIHTLNGFKELQVPSVVELESIPYLEPETTIGAWSTILIPSKNLWLDVLVESDQRSADFLFHHFTGTNAMTSHDSTSAMIQVVKTLKEQVKASFQASGEEVILPILPRRVPTSELGELSKFLVDRIRLAVGSSHIQVCVSYFVCERVSIYKQITELRPRDITDELIPLPESNHPLLNRGVMLDERKLKLLRNRFLTQESHAGIRVFEASLVSSMMSEATNGL
ncbi:MAG: hypothetical protein WCO60_10500 [Verrucomicrobiota bacterium]